MSSFGNAMFPNEDAGGGTNERDNVVVSLTA